MRIFGSLKDCECGCVPVDKPTEAGPKSDAKQCCGGSSDNCCVETAKKPDKGS